MIASAAHWSTQTVEAFLGAMPWQGSSGSGNTLAAPALVAEPLDWRSLSVRGFFSTIAWDGNGLFHPLQSDAETSQSLSYLLPIQAFFSSFSWEGRPNIGAVPQFTASPSKVTEISLDDLSDLF
jgi:hypothetical protein